MKAARLLQEEIEKRSGIQLPITSQMPSADRNTIAIGVEHELVSLHKDIRLALQTLPSTIKDGYKIAPVRGRKTILVAGNDQRSTFYGVGYLLRKCELRNKQILLPGVLSVSSSPRFPIRGQEITYSFTVDHPQQKPLFEQYLRDLICFGINFASVHTPEEARLCLEYGLDIGVKISNTGKDFVTPEGIKKELEKREKIFQSMPQLNEVFVPAGDPGKLEPDVLFNWLEKLAPVLHKYHPRAKIWVSPQNNNQGGATQEWYDTFYRRVNRNYPWFGGVVFGPWVRTPIENIRAIVHKNIPIRRFPDITHLIQCQYPAPMLDLAFAQTLGRMCIQPRPKGVKHIQNLYAHLAVGACPYSEGNSDDVNKFVWSDQDWDPETPAIETLRDYTRLFISPDYVEGVAHGLLALEKNIEGPLVSNNNVETTLLQWRDMEDIADSVVLQNPRFQLGLIRAYYDAYQKQRLIYEMHLENRAYDALREAKKLGAFVALRKAQDIFGMAQAEPISSGYKDKIEKLYHSLFMAPTPRWMTERQKCEFVEQIDIPLNDSEWLIAQFDRIRGLTSEQDRLHEVEALLHRIDPGPGGYYDNLGTEASFRRVRSRTTSENDPGTLIYPRINFIQSKSPIPNSWKLQLATLYQEPLVLAYENLDPESHYNVRVNYTGVIGRGQPRMRLVANKKYIVHDFIDTVGKPIQEFQIPQEALKHGAIEFSWTCGKGERGSPVAEVWIIKQPSTTAV